MTAGVSIQQIVHEIGEEVERRWRALDYEELAFAELASDTLRQARLHERLDFDAIVDWVLATRSLPHQHGLGSSFGEPPITIFAAPRFYTEILFWLDGTTTIHSHGFSGAFQVLVGSSIHSRYGFEVTDVVNRNVQLGTLELDEIELLQRGAVREIRPGFGLLHALFHLHRPSISLVLRTLSDSKVPQVSVFPPGIAVDTFFEDVALTQHIATLEMVARLGHPSFAERCTRLLRDADFLSTIHIFARLGPGLARAGALRAALGVAHERHGARAHFLEPALAEYQRKSQLADMRKSLQDAGHRLFLAVLMNAPDRDSAMRLLRQSHPDEDPGQLVVQWLTDLSRKGMLRVDPAGPGWDAIAQRVKGLVSATDAAGGHGVAAEQDERAALLDKALLSDPVLRSLATPAIA